MQDADESAYYELDPKDRPLRLEGHKGELALSNGARFYAEQGHPEYATAECSTLGELLTQDKAGERILAECARRRTRRLAPGCEVCLYKNNTDFVGHSYGCHDNYLISRAVPWDRLVSEVVPFLLTRQLYAGAGKLGTEAEAASGPRGLYQLSQRADFFNVLLSNDTLNRRPLINTRDEPHADPGKYRRFHVIVGDSNLSEFATALKVGTTALVLELIEKGKAPCLEIARPLEALKALSRDQSRAWRVELKDGRKVSALQIQRLYLDKALRYCDRTDREVDWLLREWEQVLNDLELDWRRCVDRLDWAAKWELLSGFQEAEQLGWADPWLQALDLEYHTIAGGQGLHEALVRAGRMRRLVSEAEVRAAIFRPPASTRAFFRGRAVARFSSQLQAIRWDEVVFSQGGQPQRVALQEALADGRLGRLNATIGEAANYEEFIRRLRQLEGKGLPKRAWW
jgi:proteasome accessory factor A